MKRRVANGVPFIEGVIKTLFANPAERKRTQRERDYEFDHALKEWEPKQLDQAAELSKKAKSAKEKKAESMRRLRLAKKPEVGTIILPHH